MTPTPAQIEAVLAEFNDELTSSQRKLITAELCRLTAAAEVWDDPVTHLNPWVLDEMKRREARTIERCAQVAETYDGMPVSYIAAAIRALAK